MAGGAAGVPLEWGVYVSQRGNCYVTSEALYHLLGGKAAGWTPKQVRHEGASHWFLQHRCGLVLDPTAGQFETPPPYDRAVGKGFLTRSPSKRACAMMQTLLWGSNVSGL